MTVSVKQPLKLKKKASTSAQSKRKLGQYGEHRAAQFLLSLGFYILDRNVAIGGGELDLVAWDQPHQELVFIEVKTRRQSYSGDPSFAVNRRKLRAVIRAAKAYASLHFSNQVPCRIDLITLVLGRVQHYPNISWGVLK